MSACCCNNGCCRYHSKHIVPYSFLNELQRNTVLTPGQIQHLYDRFCIISGLNNPPTHLFKRNFVSLPVFATNPLFTTILSSMFGDRKALSFVDFATYLSIFNSNTLRTKSDQIETAKKKKYRLLFNMYDTNKDGRITREDIIKLLHKMYADFMDQEKILHFVAILMSEMDTSMTDQIMFDDFCASLAPFDMEESLVTFIPESRN